MYARLLFFCRPSPPDTPRDIYGVSREIEQRAHTYYDVLGLLRIFSSLAQRIICRRISAENLLRRKILPARMWILRTRIVARRPPLNTLRADDTPRKRQD